MCINSIEQQHKLWINGIFFKNQFYTFYISENVFVESYKKGADFLPVQKYL